MTIPTTDTDELARLAELNRQYIRAAEAADVAWYEENLAEDYLCSRVDGSIVDRTAFLALIAQGGGTDLQSVDPVIRVVGELGLVHAGFRCQAGAGKTVTGRYTDIYARRGGRWLCVSAHFNWF